MRLAQRRSAFTLLEVMLALTIASLLLAALYVAMEVQLRYAQSGRELVDQATLARAIVITRMEADVACSVTPITGTPIGTALTNLLTSVTNTLASDGTQALGTVTPFNLGIVGDSSTLTIYISRIPRPSAAMKSDEQDTTQPTGVSDIRRITYWLVDDGGLARQDFTRITADDDPEAQIPPDEPAKYVIAPQVTSVRFRYFDGSSWVDAWDGAVSGEDGATPIGPPRAIEVTLEIRQPGTDPLGQPRQKTIKHVIAIHAANAMPAPQPTTTDNPDAETGGTAP